MAYVDFETIPQKVERIITDKTMIYEEHIPCGFCFIIVDENMEVIYSKVYRGKDCIKKFLKTVYKSTKNLFIMLEKYCEMEKLTTEQQLQFKQAEICHICQKIFEFTEIKVLKYLIINFLNFSLRSEIMITLQENIVEHHMLYAISIFLIKKIYPFLLII